VAQSTALRRHGFHRLEFLAAQLFSVKPASLTEVKKACGYLPRGYLPGPIRFNDEAAFADFAQAGCHWR